MKKIAQLRQDREKQHQQYSQETIHPKHESIIKSIKELNPKEFSFNNLNKLFKDPYFKEQVIITLTKNSVIISAHNRTTNNHMTTSTHRAHQKKQGYEETPKAFMSQIKEMLNIFGL